MSRCHTPRCYRQTASDGMTLAAVVLHRCATNGVVLYERSILQHILSLSPDSALLSYILTIWSGCTFYNSRFEGLLAVFYRRSPRFTLSILFSRALQTEAVSIEGVTVKWGCLQAVWPYVAGFFGCCALFIPVKECQSRVCVCHMWDRCSGREKAEVCAPDFIYISLLFDLSIDL